MALLEVETTNAAGKALPSPLRLQGNPDRVKRSSRILRSAIRPNRGCCRRTSGAIRMDVVTRLRTIYGTRYGVKYFSPGMVSTVLGQVEGDGKGWVFNHDATTLGGNWAAPRSTSMRRSQSSAWTSPETAGANHAHAVAAVKASHELPRVDGFDWIEPAHANLSHRKPPESPWQ